MARKSIPIDVERKLYAESMGRCMNPNCQAELFRKKGDVIEKAHITPYCKTADNVYENLVVLCPTCHTDFDKNDAFPPEEVKQWKQIRKEELDKLFGKKYATFNELQLQVAPILSENKSIYENYYLNDQKDLWDKFEGRILANNRKLKVLLEKNLGLIQSHTYPDKTSPTEKTRIYRNSLLKFATKKCVLSAFCSFIVIPISLAFLKAGGVSPILSLLILNYMVKKRAPIILGDIGLF